MNNQNQGLRGALDCTFTSSATSAEVWLKGSTIVGIKFPSGFSGTSITFSGRVGSDTTYYPVLATAITVAASKIVPIDPLITACFDRVKVVSNASESATVVLITQPVV